MATEGELLYYEVIGEAGKEFACHKPFSDPDGPFVLMQVGAVLAALPPPPARILECGCGTGWLSSMIARRGYECLGIDVAPQAIDLARSMPGAAAGNPSFLTLDAERMDFEEAFDGVIFFDSLHHAVDEAAVIRNAFRALRPGGVCVASEPGKGHHQQSAEVIRQFDVTEKDMPVSHIARLGRAAGFRGIDTYPRFDDLGRFFFRKAAGRSWWRRRIDSIWPLNLLKLVRHILAIRRKCDTGLVVLRKLPVEPAANGSDRRLGAGWILGWRSPPTGA